MVGVRAMNGYVAHGASLIFLRLIVKRGNRRRARIDGKRMTLEAHQVHLAAFQQPGIRRTVRRMAGHATLNLYGFVFEYKWPGFVGVTLVTDSVLRGGGSQLSVQESTVRVVAVAAFHQAFIYAVMKWAVELLLGLKVAPIAKLRLRHFHQVFLLFGVVRRMTIYAAHVVLQVRRTRIVAVFFAVGMAPQAAGADIFCGGVLKGKNLSLVASPLDVLFPGAMTRFASVPLRSFLGI